MHQLSNTFQYVVLASLLCVVLLGMSVVGNVHTAPQEQLGQAVGTTQRALPSLYGYSTGQSSYVLQELQATVCKPELPVVSGSTKLLDYEHIVYNVNLANLDEYGETLYREDIRRLMQCARQSGKLRVILNFNFYEYDSAANSSTSKKSDYQKNQICRTSTVGVGMSSACKDTFDAYGNVTRYGYIEPNVTRAVAAYKRLLGDVALGTDMPELKLTFQGSGYAVLAGITLSEENVTWDYVRQSDGTYKIEYGRRATFLDNLYNELRKAYPTSTHWTYKFLQWYSPNKIPNYPGYNSNWPVLNADGWVFDQYHLNVLSGASSALQSQYYTYASSVSKLAKDKKLALFSVVFTSPLRNPTAATRGINTTWWNSRTDGTNDGGWVKFYGQVAINKRFNIPTIYYSYTPVLKADSQMDKVGGTVKTSQDQVCGINILNFLRDTTFPTIKASTTMSLTIPTIMPSWIPGAPSGCEYLDTKTTSAS